MKALLLIFSLFAFTSSFTTAQRANPYLDCKREPNPSSHHLKQDLRQVQTALSENKVAVFYVLANDEEYSEAEFQAIRKATREIQAWYQINTGGVTYAFADPDTVSFYRAEHNTSYYRENWWGLLLPEMEMAGLPIWQPGIIVSLWIKTGRPKGIGEGAQWCEGQCGVAIAGVENFPEFNDFGECPTDPEGNMWPCVPHGTMAHELGHAFGLPHPDEVEETADVASHSLMLTHSNYPDKAPEWERPWGLLTVERVALWNNPFFQQGVFLRQIYDADIVNLPVTGLMPTVKFSSSTKDLTVKLNNNTKNAWLYYWTLGDGSVSNEVSPSYTYAQPGTYTVTLRASNAAGMTAIQRMTVHVTEPKKQNKPIHVGPIKIYPNPSIDGRFTISFPSLPFAVYISVHDAMGKPIINQTLSNTSRNLELDLSSFGRGIYYIRVEMKGATFTQRLVVL